eukprot:746927-Hanusia_phi.AAC.1
MSFGLLQQDDMSTSWREEQKKLTSRSCSMLASPSDPESCSHAPAPWLPRRIASMQEQMGPESSTMDDNCRS